MKTTKSLAKSAACSLTAVLLVPGVTHAQVGSTISYKLNPGSTYQTGCFPPCACPLSQEFELSGTFTLTCMYFNLSAQGGGQKFIIQNAEWMVQLPDSSDLPIPVVGVGSYEWIGIGPGRFKTAGLELEIGNLPRSRFASGAVNALPLRFPDIRITVTSNNKSCQDTVITIDASPVGACCPNGPNGPDDPACLIATEAECVNQSGAYQGDGSTCPTEPGVLCGVAEGVTVTCAHPADSLWHACCFPFAGPSEPACLILTEQECTSAGGTFLFGAACDPVLCDATLFACCPSDLHFPCVDTFLANCHGTSSIAPGTCSATDCASVVGGVCCAADQSVARPCFEATPEACAFAGGTYQGDGSTCTFGSAGICGPYTGACCLANASATQATCEVTTFDACLAADGIYQGDHTACGAGECDCCFPLRSCTTMPAGVCSDTLSRLPAIPTVSAWGTLIMALLLGAVGSAVIVRPRIRPAGSQIAGSV